MMFWVLCGLMSLQGCSLIDDDLSVCGTDFELRLEMQLVTNLDLELETVLSAETDIYTRTILHDYFSHIFTDHAHDINIGFFSTATDELVYSIHDTIDANQSTYTFYLPKDDYHAIALANLDENRVVTLAGADNSRMARLVTPSQDSLSTQETGLFVVSRDVTVQDTADQKIDLTLHMANSSVALVIDTTGVSVKGLRAYVRGTAGEFYLRDSLYLFDSPHTVVMDHIIPQTSASAAGRMPYQADSVSQTIPYLFGSTSFPSADVADANGAYYIVAVYASMPDGTTTETLLSVLQSLPAGALKVFKTELQPNGEVKPVHASELGVTVTLDWKDGGSHDIEL